MKPLPQDVTDETLIAVVDRWAQLLEAEDYGAAYALTDHDPRAGWTPDLLCEVVKAYGDADPRQRVTVEGRSTDVSQRKQVDRDDPDENGYAGEVWYDLNIDGEVTDLTATFDIVQTPRGVTLRLSDLHVM